MLKMFGLQLVVEYVYADVLFSLACIMHTFYAGDI